MLSDMVSELLVRMKKICLNAPFGARRFLTEQNQILGYLGALLS